MPTIASSVYDQLLRQGPCTEEHLLDGLRTAGLSTARTTAGVHAALEGHAFTLRLPDGRWLSIARLLTGAVLTTRPAGRPLGDVLWVHADLAPFDALYREGVLPLRGGGQVSRGRGRVPTLVGPSGWLPDVPPGELLALRWDGEALSVSAAGEAPTTDSPGVRAVQGLLRKHARALAERTSGVGFSAFPERSAPSRAEVVLSALQEQPDLLTGALPPLSELLPLPESWLPSAGGGRFEGGAHALEVLLPGRVLAELDRRAGLLGDHLPDYAGMLLGAAVDRVLPAAGRCDCRGMSWSMPEPWCSREPEDDDEPVRGAVVRLDDWQR